MNAKKRIKLADIAKELNVSVGLVSVVLSGKAKEQRISESISIKVKEKADELGYKANRLARGLRTGRSGIIGLIVADIGNPYFGKMARHIENEAARLGYQIMIGSSDENDEKLSQLIELFQSRQVDGIIVVPVAGSENIILKSQQSGLPTILIDRYCEKIDEDFVCTDNFEAANLLTKLLLERGYNKIAAFVYNTRNTNYIDRVKGYQAAIDSCGNQEKAHIYEVDYSHVETRLEPYIKNALKIGCNGFFFANNTLGIHSLEIIDSLKLKLGENIGFVSFDNPSAFQVAKPSITCYEQPIQRMSHLAVQGLVEKMSKLKNRKKINLFIEGKLIIRDSC